MVMRSITDLTWKDAAIIEIRSMLARMEDYSASFSNLTEERFNSLIRQAAKLADIIDKIEAKK